MMGWLAIGAMLLLGAVWGWHRGGGHLARRLLRLCCAPLVLCVLLVPWYPGLGLVALTGGFLWWSARARKAPAEATHPGLAGRMLGGALGAGIGCLACLGIAWTLTASLALSRAKEHHPALAALGHSAADWAGQTDTVLGWIPIAGEGVREVHALTRLLSLPRQELMEKAERHGLLALQEAPAVQAALKDSVYLEQVLRLGHGDLRVVPTLMRHPRTVALWADEQVAASCRRWRPSAMLAGEHIGEQTGEAPQKKMDVVAWLNDFGERIKP